MTAGGEERERGSRATSDGGRVRGRVREWGEAEGAVARAGRREGKRDRERKDGGRVVRA